MAFGEFEHQDFGEQRLEVDEQVEKLLKLLEPFGADFVEWDLSMKERTLSMAQRRLVLWKTSVAPNAPTILYWAGHGFRSGRGYALACYESRDDVPGSGLAAEHLASFIQDRQARSQDPPWCIVIVDACCGHDVAIELCTRLVTANVRNVLLIGAAEPGATRLGEITRALTLVLEEADFRRNLEISLINLKASLRDESVRQHLSVHDVELLPSARLESRARLRFAVSLDLQAGFESALSALSQDEREALVQRIDLDETTWQFVGRKPEHRRIVEWAASTEPLLIVSGPPGAGKSALLGATFVRSWPGLREKLERQGVLMELEPDEAPPADAFRAVIRLSGHTTMSAMRLIGDALDWCCHTTASPTEQMQALREAAAATGALLIADGVDEARQPLGVARLLRVIADAGARVLVGTRPSTKDVAGAEASPHQDILEVLTDRIEAEVIDLGYRHEDLTEFVISELDAKRYGRFDAPYRRAKRVHIVRILADEQRADFLLASLVLRELAADTELLESGREEDLDRLLRKDLRAIFDQLVARLAAKSASNRAILQALALAQGRGMPVAGDVLAATAAALSEDTSAPVTRSDIAELFRDARAYIVSDLEDGQTVYRFAHKLFSDLLGGDDAAKHDVVARALIAQAGDGTEPPSPYVVRWLSRHVANGGPAAWAALGNEPALIDALDVAALTSDAQRAGLSTLPRDVVATISVQNLIAESALDTTIWGAEVAGRGRSRSGLRQLGAARLRPTGGAAQSPPGVTGWSLRWSELRRTPPHILAIRADAPVIALVCAENRPVGEDARPVIAALFEDGAIRLWDTTSGSALGPPIVPSGAGGKVANGALALVEAEGQAPFLVAGIDSEVTVWDLLTGVRITSMAPHRPVTALTAESKNEASGDPADLRIFVGSRDGTVTSLNAAGVISTTHKTAPPGRALRSLVMSPPGMAVRLLAGGDDELVRSYFVTENGELRPAGADPSCHALDEWVCDLAAYDENKQLHVAVVGDEAMLAVWDVDTSERRTAPIPEPSTSVITFVQGDERKFVAGGKSGGLHVVRASELISRPTVPRREAADPGAVVDAHQDTVAALASYTLGEIVRVVSGSADGTVKIWEPDLRTDDGAVRPGSGAACVASVTAPDGTALIAVGTADGVVQFYDAAGIAVYASTLRVAGRNVVVGIRELPDGRAAIAVKDENVVLWDLASRTSTELKHDAPVTAMTVAEIDGTVILLTATTRGRVTAWDVAAREELTSLRHDVQGSVSAFIQLGDVVAAFGSGRGAIVIPLKAGASGAVADRKAVARVTAACRVGAALVVGDTEGLVYVWPLDGTGQARELTGHRQAVTSLAPIEGGALVLSGSRDGTVRIWDVGSGDEVDVIRFGIGVNDLHVLPDGAVAIATDEGVLVVELNAPHR
ncbi:WD40 repeat domain-containing protein [Conexibacter woesei]|uniref:WD40 repeat domain-containing protein n=1 Tax=Conexibacter woesei TaxID=191495 RepID=UPI00040EF35C|nr:WD40 repeat domain-containing protein [Conexibacter woesei]